MHFNNEVQISGVNKKVRISDLSPLYVGIRKKRTSQNDLDFFVHSGDSDFLSFAKKYGLFAPALVIKIVEPTFLLAYSPPAHMPQPTPSSPFPPMPPKGTTKKWGQADRDHINDLINRQLVDITNTTYQNIKQVRLAHFRHRDPKNFRPNFRDFAAAWDLEIEYSGARRRKSGGKMRRLLLLISSSIRTSSNDLPPPPRVLSA